LVVAIAAAAEPVELAWNAPPACPSREAVLADVQRILGTTTSHHAVARADLTEVGPDHWSLHLSTEVDGAAGERTLEANSCNSLASAAALILAWTVDPEKARAAAPSGATAPSPGVVVPEHPRPATEPARPGEPLRFVVAASGAGGIGTLPSIAAAGEIAVGVTLGPLRVELSAADWASQGVTDVSRPNEGTQIHLLEGGLRGCFRGKLTTGLELDPCLGAALVAASSDGFGGNSFTPNQQSSQWFAMRADVLAVLHVAGPLSVRASAGIDVPFVRPQFVLTVQQGQHQTTDFLHQASAVAGRGTLGAEVRFP
jgi:hypothetical protein